MQPILGYGALAQLVEQWTENPCVPGSIPGGTTLKTATLTSRGFFVSLLSNFFKPQQMIVQTLSKLFKRDLNRLKAEVEAYTAEDKLWLSATGISNCGGNLCLHLIGNLNAFIGAELGNTGYVRQRELEFSQKNVPRVELISQIENTIQMVDSTLEKLSEENLNNEYPLIVLKEKMTTGFFLMYLTTHLAYHLGQVNYHRRLLDH